MHKLKNLLLNEKLILLIILVNSIVIFLQESKYNSLIINIVDISCTFIFIIEMIVKHIEYGFRGYWSNNWNKMDGTLTLLSMPSIMTLFLPREFIDTDFLLILRLLRVFRLFRLIHVFPNFSQIAKNFWLALKESYAIMIGMVILTFIFGLVSCNLFGELAPEYFDTPLHSIYSTFRLFTGEGWNEIPDTISAAMGENWGHIVRIYFCGLLILGCIIGMSLLNSIFVDAMVSDNNDDIKQQLNELQAELNELTRMIQEKETSKRKE